MAVAASYGASPGHTPPMSGRLPTAAAPADNTKFITMLLEAGTAIDLATVSIVKERVRREVGKGDGRQQYKALMRCLKEAYTSGPSAQPSQKVPGLGAALLGTSAPTPGDGSAAVGTLTPSGHYRALDGTLHALWRLHAATADGNIQVMAILLANGVAVNRARPDSGARPLVLACLSSSLEAVLMLLQADADPNLANEHEDGMTPLFAACMMGNTNMVPLLVEYGAETSTPLAGKD